MNKKTTRKNRLNYIGKVAALIMFAVVMALVPIKEAYAAEQVVIDKIKYELDAGSHTAAVKNYDWEAGALGDVTIPSQITHNEEVYTVTGIRSFAFQCCDSITSISIPSSVTVIGARAFEDCIALTSVNIPSSVTLIDSYTFCGCTQLNSVTFDTTSHVERIEAGAFWNCTSLTSITLPASLTFVDSNAFKGCYRLQFNVEAGNANYSAQGGTLYNKDKTVLISHPAGGTCTVADTVTTIGTRAFSYNEQLQSVVLPENLEIIEDEAFQGAGLTTLSLPLSLQTIGDHSFFGCSNLESIVIPGNVQSVGSYAFWSCENLKEFFYPANLDISSARINYSNNNTSIISYIENNDGTIAFTIENYADGVTTVSLSKEFAGKKNAPATTMDVTCINTVVSDIALPEHWQWSSLDENTLLELGTPVTVTAVYESNNSITTNVTITKKHSNTTIKNAKSASCKETGYTGDTWCNDCSTTLGTGSVIAKTNNHSFDGGVVTTQASETQKGVKTYTCTVCGTTKTEEIPMIEVPVKEEPKEETDTEAETEETEQEEVIQEDLPVKDDVVEPEVTEPSSEEVTPEEEESDKTTSMVVEAEIVEKSNFNIWFVVVPSVIVLGAGAGVGVFAFKKRK